MADDDEQGAAGAGVPGPLGRRRRGNAPEGQKREKSYAVYVTADEDVQLRARAIALGVTVPRLLFEAAMNLHVETTAERKGAIAELFAARRLLGTVANNVNQLARFANTEGVFPREAEAVLAEYRALVPQVQDAVRRLAEP